MSRPSSQPLSSPPIDLSGHGGDSAVLHSPYTGGSSHGDHDVDLADVDLVRAGALDGGSHCVRAAAGEIHSSRAAAGRGRGNGGGPAELSPLLTAQEAADFLGGGLSAKTIREKAGRGELPCLRFGPRIVRFDREDLLAWGRQAKREARRS